MKGSFVHRVPVGVLAFAVGIGVALIAPIVAFAVFTRTTIDSDLSARLQDDREVTARLAAAVAKQRIQNDAANLARFAGRPEVAESVRTRDREGLGALLAEFSTPLGYKAVGVVTGHGDLRASHPAGPVDPSFAADVVANAGSASQGWTLMEPDDRAPTRTGPGAVVVVSSNVGEPFEVYGYLDVNHFASTFNAIALPDYRSIVLVDETGRILASGSSGLVPMYTNFGEFPNQPVYRLQVPGLKQALSSDIGTETATIGGQEQIATHVAVLPGHWVLYLLDAPAAALAAERRLTEQVTIGAGVAAVVAVVLAVALAALLSRLRRQRQEIALANQHKSEFLANMSHELRTPLNSIIGFSEVLLEKMFGDLNPRQEDYVNDILSSGKHQLALINDILDLSKVEAGKMELHPTEFNLADAMTSVHRSVLPLAHAKRQQMLLVIDDAVGTAELDEARVRQVLLNLLSNAVKYTPEGGAVTTQASMRKDILEISVSDTGVGIAPEDADKVFQEFERVGTGYSRAQAGTGLGLGLARRFARLMGGDITLASEPGHGSTFTLWMPTAARSH